MSFIEFRRYTSVRFDFTSKLGPDEANRVFTCTADALCVQAALSDVFLSAQNGLLAGLPTTGQLTMGCGNRQKKPRALCPVKYSLVKTTKLVRTSLCGWMSD